MVNEGNLVRVSINWVHFDSKEFVQVHGVN